MLFPILYLFCKVLLPHTRIFIFIKNGIMHCTFRVESHTIRKYIFLPSSPLCVSVDALAKRYTRNNRFTVQYFCALTAFNFPANMHTQIKYSTKTLDCCNFFFSTTQLHFAKCTPLSLQGKYFAFHIYVSVTKS